MSQENETLTVRVNVEITPAALQTLVANAKQLAGKNEKGHYQVDTADKLGELLSRFMREKDFDGYVRDLGHYTR